MDIWGSYYNIPRTIFFLLKRDFGGVTGTIKLVIMDLGLGGNYEEGVKRLWASREAILQSRGRQYRPQYAKILIITTPKIPPIILGISQVMFSKLQEAWQRHPSRVVEWS